MTSTEPPPSRAKVRPLQRVRRRSPLGGRRPTKAELPGFVGGTVDDVIGDSIDLLIVGINPGLWTAAVNAPFAHPSNRFWPSVHAAGFTDYRIDATAGLSAEDAAHVCERGLGLTNLVDRATARADELTAAELRAGRDWLEGIVAAERPRAVAIVGITAYRTGWREPRAVIGKQGTFAGAELWVVPQPSGLNAHFTPTRLAEIWRTVWHPGQ